MMTATAKHTRGPWTVKTRRTIYGRAVEVWLNIGKTEPNATGEAYFQVQPYQRPDEAEANARLIAAAPTMLDALKTICEARDHAAEHGHYPECVGDECFDDWAANVAQAAIDATTT